MYFEHLIYHRISFVEGMNNMENHMDERAQAPRQHRRCQERCRKVITEDRRFRFVCNLQCVSIKIIKGSVIVFVVTDIHIALRKPLCVVLRITRRIALRFE